LHVAIQNTDFIKVGIIYGSLYTSNLIDVGTVRIKRKTFGRKERKVNFISITSIQWQVLLNCTCAALLSTQITFMQLHSESDL